MKQRLSRQPHEAGTSERQDNGPDWRKPHESLQSGVTGTCGAKTRDGTPCAHPAGWGTDHPGVGRCKLHGGATPRGPESPHFKHGMYSRTWYVPEDTQDTPGDDELDSLRHEAAAAMYWADRLARAPGAVPPVTVLSALRLAAEIKSRYLQVDRDRAVGDTLQALDTAVREIVAAIAEVQLTPEQRHAIGVRLHQIAERLASSLDTGERRGAGQSGRR